MSIKLRPIQWGALISLIAILMCVLFGMIMGADEAGLREAWKNQGMAFLDSFYKGDEAAVDAMVGVAFETYLRAHVHWGAIGAVTLGMSFIFLLIKVPNWYSQVGSIFLGLGALLYPISWYTISIKSWKLVKLQKKEVHIYGLSLVLEPSW